MAAREAQETAEDAKAETVTGIVPAGAAAEVAEAAAPGSGEASAAGGAAAGAVVVGA